MSVASGQTANPLPVTQRVLAPGAPSLRTVIWLLCHYPDTEECDERVQAAARLHCSLGVSIWLFGSCSARYPTSVEQMIKDKLIGIGVPRDQVFCSGEMGAQPPSLDTVQEALNIAAEAEKQGINTLVGVSNRLQLAQAYGLLRRRQVQLILVPTPLRDRRWWYVAGRVLLIPLAFLGIGRGFLPLVWTRVAREKWPHWPF